MKPSIPLEMNNLSFNERCYLLLQKIPQGRVTTYKLLAEALNTKAYQAVGNAMHNNPNPVIVPCHRVIKADGSLGGYAFGSIEKQRLLEKEGIVIKMGKIENLSTVLFDFKTLN